MSVEKRIHPSGRTSWRARVYLPNGHQRSKSFPTKREAVAWEQQFRAAKRSGGTYDPARGRIALRALWDEYATVTSLLKAPTRAAYGNAWKVIDQEIGGYSVGAITHQDVQGFIDRDVKRRGPSSARYAAMVLGGLLGWAVKTGRIPVNPAEQLRLPAPPPPRTRMLTADEVEGLLHELAKANAPAHDPVLAMIFLGLRFSEVAGLRVRDVDLARRRVRVTQRVTTVGGRIDIDRPKSAASRREVPIPRRVEEMLRRRLEGRALDDLIFPAPRGGYLRRDNWRQRAGLDAAVERAGIEPGLTAHDLRRTYGSLARAAGADLRWIQKTLGHASITTSATIYSHLYNSELDTVADAMDRITTASTDEATGPKHGPDNPEK